MSDKILINKDNDSEPSCYICYDCINIADHKNIVICLKCKKTFHLICMQTWKETGISVDKKECPYCFHKSLKYPKNRTYCFLTCFK
tara:strand:+ start:65 stop:322 length:258 start_codon:yes stop_codon:yes gene_type:complete